MPLPLMYFGYGVIAGFLFAAQERGKDIGIDAN